MAHMDFASHSGGSSVCGSTFSLSVDTSVFHRCCDRSGDRGVDMMNTTTECEGHSSVSGMPALVALFDLDTVLSQLLSSTVLRLHTPEESGCWSSRHSSCPEYRSSFPVPAVPRPERSNRVFHSAISPLSFPSFDLESPYRSG